MAVWRYVTKTRTRLLDIDPNDPGQGKAELPIAVDLVFHVDIPDVNNPVNVSYRVACKDEQWNEEQNKVVPLVSDLLSKNVTVYNNLQAGAVFQKPETFKFSSAYLTKAQRDAELDARMQVVGQEILDQKQNEWQYWGNTDTG